MVVVSSLKIILPFSGTDLIDVIWLSLDTNYRTVIRALKLNRVYFVCGVFSYLVPSLDTFIITLESKWHCVRSLWICTAIHPFGAISREAIWMEGSRGGLEAIAWTLVWRETICTTCSTEERYELFAAV